MGASRGGDLSNASPARLMLDPAFRVGPLSRRLFGSFVEHMGRCVYTGSYEPDHDTADEHGFRTDVQHLVLSPCEVLATHVGTRALSTA